MNYYIVFDSDSISPAVFSHAREYMQEIRYIETNRVCMRPDPEPSTEIHLMMRSMNEVGRTNFIAAINAKQCKNQTDYPGRFDVSKYA